MGRLRMRFEISPKSVVFTTVHLLSQSQRGLTPRDLSDWGGGGWAGGSYGRAQAVIRREIRNFGLS